MKERSAALAGSKTNKGLRMAFKQDERVGGRRSTRLADVSKDQPLRSTTLVDDSRSTAQAKKHR